MSFNLMDLAKGALGKQAMGSIGGLLGTDEKATGGAINAALPALIGGMMKKSSSSAGAGEMFGMLDKFDGGLLENIGGIFDGGQKQSGLLEMGQKILSMLFGGNLSSILETISKVAGLNSGTVGKLLGVLGPIVMSVLGKQKKAAGWDIGQFSSAMADQKSALAGLDPGLTESLGIGNLMSAGKDMAADAGRAATQAVGGARDMAGQAAGGGMNLLKILLPLILLAGLAFLAWQFLIKSEPGDVTDGKGTNPKAAVPGEASSNVAVSLGEMFTGASDAITGVTDESSAQSAVDKLNGITSKLDGLKLGNLTGPAKMAAGAASSGFLGKLDSLLEKAYAIPGVEAILKPAIDALRAKLGPLG